MQFNPNNTQCRHILTTSHIPCGTVSLRAYFGRLHRLICSVSIIPSILSRFFLWLLQRSRMMALKSSLHRKSVYNECLSTKKILWIELIDNSLVMIGSRQVAFFGVKLLRTGGTSSDAALAVGWLAGSLPQIFSFLKNLGIPSTPSDCTLALSPLCPQLLTCTNNGQPCRRSSIELHKEGKELNV